MSRRCSPPSTSRLTTPSYASPRSAAATSTPRTKSSKVSQRLPTANEPGIALNVSLATLLERIGSNRETLYCYIISTIENEHGRYCQRGSGPNFEGGVITLCTCKHSMRALLTAPAWQGKWIAGVTGWNAQWDRHYLVYLMQVGSAYRSQAAIYRSLPSAAQNAKAAESNKLGDLYRPKAWIRDEDNADHYDAPREDHTHCREGWWRSDIEYRDRFGRRAAYLAGSPSRSFFWDRPQIIADVTLQRGHLKYDSMQEFARTLLPV